MNRQTVQHRLGLLLCALRLHNTKTASVLIQYTNTYIWIVNLCAPIYSSVTHTQKMYRLQWSYDLDIEREFLSGYRPVLRIRMVIIWIVIRGLVCWMNGCKCISGGPGVWECIVSACFWPFTDWQIENREMGCVATNSNRIRIYASQCDYIVDIIDSLTLLSWQFAYNRCLT